MSGDISIEGKKLTKDGVLQPIDLTVKTGDKKIYELEAELREEKAKTEELTSRADDLQSKLELLATKKLEEKVDSIEKRWDVSVPEEISKNPTKLQAFEEGLKGRKSTSPSGQAPLNKYQEVPILSDKNSEGFDNYREMFEAISVGSRISGSKGAEGKILDAFMAKSLKTLKEHPTSQVITVDEPLKDILNRRARMERELRQNKTKEGEVTE
jgi:hypothetical protein